MIYLLTLPWPIRVICLAVAVCCLYGLSVYHSYALGQYRTMYDNPIYRWRISIAVALSELRDPPLRGFVAYGTIVEYLNAHGLALMPGESSTLPHNDDLERLIYDPTKLDRLFREAAVIPIDLNLPPVPIVGSEKGEAAFYHWAFELFGVHIVSLWYFYFLLLAASAAAFFVTFWRDPFSVLLLMLYLVCHFCMIDIASLSIFQTVHNSRFFPVLAVLPSMHLLLLALRRAPPRLNTVALAIGQASLLYFMVFGRLQTAWQALAILVVAAAFFPYRDLGQLLQERPHRAAIFSRVVEQSGRRR